MPANLLHNKIISLDSVAANRAWIGDGMSVIVTPPDTKEIKTVLQDSLSHGDAQKIANILGVSHSVISNRFNRNNEQKVYIAEAAREFWAIACANPDAYQVVKTYFVMLLDSWAEPVPTSDKSLSSLVGEAARNLNKLQEARFIDGRSENVQREETLAIITALQQFLAGLGKQLELKNGVAKFPKAGQR